MRLQYLLDVWICLYEANLFVAMTEKFDWLNLYVVVYSFEPSI